MEDEEWETTKEIKELKLQLKLTLGSRDFWKAEYLKTEKERIAGKAEVFPHEYKQ